jgi:hypothetical protein
MITFKDSYIGGRRNMNIVKKTMVLAVIGLFFGAGVIPSIADVNKNESMRMDTQDKGLHPPTYCDFVQDFEYGRDDGLFDETSYHSSPIHSPSDGNKSWTFMFYDDADFQGYDPLTDSYGGISFAEAAYSGENVDVIVLQDTDTGPATLWYIDDHYQLEKLEDMEEVNMGDTTTLQQFLDYGKNTFPADRYVLALYNHGGGMWGACIDSTNGDLLTMDEMQKALHETGGVDLLCFTAPCYMGAFESAYELKDCVDVYIGSEEKSGYTFWHDPMALFFETLHENPDISTSDLGIHIIDWIEASAKTNIIWGFLITMSAIRTDSMRELGASIDQLSIYINEHFNETIKHVMKARRRTKEVGSHRQTIDLLDFIQRYSDIENDPVISQYLTAITETLNEAILKECHRLLYRNDHGLSIYFPEITLLFGYTRSYDDPDYGLDFPQDTHWDEFLRNYYEYELGLFRMPFVQFS